MHTYTFMCRQTCVCIGRSYEGAHVTCSEQFWCCNCSGFFSAPPSWDPSLVMSGIRAPKAPRIGSQTAVGISLPHSPVEVRTEHWKSGTPQSERPVLGQGGWFPPPRPTRGDIAHKARKLAPTCCKAEMQTNAGPMTWGRGGLAGVKLLTWKFACWCAFVQEGIWAPII